MAYDNPYKLTPETYAKIVECANKGLPLPLVSAKAKITMLTLRNWLDQGAKDAQLMDDDPEHISTMCGRLYLDIQAAYAEYAMKLLDKLTDSAQNGNIRSADFILSKTFPNVFGDLRNIQQSQEALDKPKDQPILDVPDEQRSKIMAQIASRTKDLKAK